ncbi:hypothetical protein GCM10010324_67690 [Streptomyces hiroshimensis]|uniref:Uncharacterized protein n=1 Tax=Streptomyces hiroshimensis TaxID=66424 RepID=A0ABQ2ZBX9_9ACTN|nr:hypothetical protein GCM10010324_67690 [Streptomyces hiroshimensis]
MTSPAGYGPAADFWQRWAGRPGGSDDGAFRGVGPDTRALPPWGREACKTVTAGEGLGLQWALPLDCGAELKGRGHSLLIAVLSRAGIGSTATPGPGGRPC